MTDINQLITYKAICQAAIVKHTPVDIQGEIDAIQSDIAKLQHAISDLEVAKALALQLYLEQMNAADENIRAAFAAGDTPDKNHPLAKVSTKKAGVRETVAIDDVRTLIKTGEEKYQFLKNLVKTTPFAATISVVVIPDEELLKVITPEQLMEVEESISRGGDITSAVDQSDMDGDTPF